MENWKTTEMLITGKAYPSPSKKHKETVCTGGITRAGELIRIYPVPYRYLVSEKQYKKWAWISVEIQKALDDPRKESYRINEDSVRIIGEATEDEKLKYILDLESENHDLLDEYYEKECGSLGFIRIHPIEFYWKEASPDWGVIHQKMLDQLRLFEPPPKLLEKIKWEFRLKFKCWNRCSVCEKGEHDKTFLTWEIYEAFRNFRNKYRGEEEGLNKVKEKFINVFSEKKYCLLLLGTHVRHKNIWMIGDFFCPNIDVVQRFKSYPTLPFR